MFKRSKVASAALMALGGLLATAAVAQDAQRVEITGSRILSVNAESPAPIQVLTAEDIAASGVTNVQELLLKNPVFGVPGLSRTNSNFVTSSAGVSTIDLRNLGTARTLVLINGRRVVSGIPGEAAVDLNTIPTQFVERIEILTGGASATYGSDAVAGVVNIILKKDYEGFNVDYKYGISERGDDKRHELALTWGSTSANGKGNVMGHFGYSKQGAVFSKDRDISAVDQASLGAFFTGELADLFTVQRPFFSSFAPQGRFFYQEPNPLVGQPIDPDDPAAGVHGPFRRTSRTFNPDGSIVPFSTNGPAGDGVGAHGFNRSEFRTIAVPTERFLFASKGSYEIADNHRAFFEGTYAASHTKSRLEPYPLGSVDIFPATGGAVAADFLYEGAIRKNPLIPQALYDRFQDVDGDGIRLYDFTRRMAEVGTRGNVADRDTFRIVTGLEGRLFKAWDYQLYAGYGATKESQVSSGQVNVLNFRYALEAVPDVTDLDGDGDITEAICLDANARAQGCVPINVFGAGAVSPAAAQYIQAPGLLATFTSQKLLGGSVSGEPFKLPAGPVGVAAGFEYREEFARSEFDPLQQAGLNAGNAIPRTEGGFDVKELFAEVRLPLLKDAPFAKALNVTGAVRGGKYSTVGSTLSWNTGVDWAINDMFTVRATAAVSTRAPNINELFSPPSQDFPTGLVDPCKGVTLTSVGAKDDNCRAAPGVLANINDPTGKTPAEIGTFTQTQADQQGISGFNRGNPNLDEEKGKSWTLGLAFKPRGMGYLDNFALTVDYFNIEIEDAIVSTDRQFILDRCYNNNDPAFCQFITRLPAVAGANSAGSLDLVDSGVTNSGGLATEGVDFTVNFADRVGPGRLSAALSYTHLLEGYEIAIPGAPRNPFMGEVGFPRDKFTFKLGYKWNAFAVTGVVTHIAESALDDQFLTSLGLAPGSAKVGAKTYTDLGLSYQLNKTVQLYGGIDNLFDTKPAPVISGLPGNDTGTETNAGTYDPIGRRYYIGVRAQF